MTQENYEVLIWVFGDRIVLFNLILLAIISLWAITAFVHTTYVWLFVVMTSLLYGCGSGGGSGGEPGKPPPPPTGWCGSGLASQDLSGTCRAKPNPTMGSLEAVNG